MSEYQRDSNSGARIHVPTLEERKHREQQRELHVALDRVDEALDRIDTLEEQLQGLIREAKEHREET